MKTHKLNTTHKLINTVLVLYIIRLAIPIALMALVVATFHW